MSDWTQIVRRMQAGEDLEALLDEAQAKDNAEFVAWLRQEAGDEAADRHLAKMREIDTGIYGARNAWASLSPAQRRVLTMAADHPQVKRGWPHVAIATLRNLCARDLLAWDGGAFDPEAAAVITERGRFVLRVAPQPAGGAG